MRDWSKHPIDEKEIPGLIRDLPPVEADANFRMRLRNAFTEGGLESGPVIDERAESSRPLFGWLRWPAAVAAAAVAVLIAVVVLNRPADLRIAEVVGEGEVRLDGQTIDLADEAALAAGIRAGAEIETPPGALIDLISGDVMLLEIAGGTRMSIPPMPGRWFACDIACSLHVGAIHIKTGRDFTGSELLVYTPEGIIAVTGTMLSIDRGEGWTCVCVLEGIVHVGADDDSMEPVKPGDRKVMHADGTAEIIPIEAAHRDAVLDFDKRLGDRIESGGEMD
jgi:ferric-dicitrate binding protein FerR (iron transport regulator)